MEASSGIVLMLATALALGWANSPWASGYFSLWQTPLNLLILEKPILLWINDGLMAVFFFLVGLEIKREIMVGELASVKMAALPIAAAVGGMAVPATIFALFNYSGDGIRGWGIPMATDIAFALGVLSLLGSRVPLSLKVFLTAVAIVDDIGAILVIAIFYSEGIQWALVGGGFAILALLGILNRIGIRSLAAYLLPGLVLWFLFLKSGVHATVAGVLLAMALPAHAKSDHSLSPLERLEHVLQPYVSYGIMPLFALANAGVALGAGALQALGQPIGLGVALGLLVGKPIGILLASWLAVKAGLAALPNRVRWGQMLGVGVLAGIGFTMSLFITELAFADPESVDAAKVAILAASVLAGVVGYTILRKSTTQTP